LTSSENTLKTDSDLDLRQRTVKALSHPIRLKALTILNERVASPSEIAQELDESLGVVSYHMRTLERLGCIELVRRAQRRGAVEHYYRAIVRPWIPDEQILELPKSLRRSLSGSTFQYLIEDVDAATKGNGFDRPDYCMVRVSLLLHEEAWSEVSKLLQTVFDRAVELAGETQNRIAETGSDEGVVPAVLGMQLFERRAKEHERQLKAATAPPKPETASSIEFGDQPD
jgi:DNA-binding transcriptional ArsR family regulator